MNAEKDLLNGDGGPPVLFLVKDRKTHGSGRVHIWVEQGRVKLAYIVLAWTGVSWWKDLHFGGLVGYSRRSVNISIALGRCLLTIRESHLHFEKSTFPKRVGLARNRTLPSLQVEAALGIACGLCDKSEWVIATPLLSNRTSQRGTEDAQ